MALQERNQNNGYRAVGGITAKVNDTYGNSDEDFFPVYYNMGYQEGRKLQRRISMKSWTINTMKKAAVLFVALCIAFAMTAPVYGANSGPNTAKDTKAYIKISTPAKNYEVYSCDSSLKTSAPKGVKYSKKTNTLTLTKYSGKNAVIEANEMGDNFKIKISGTCNVGKILVWGFGYGGSLRITGKGTLNINKGKPFECAVFMNAEESASRLVIDKTVNLNAYAHKGGAPAIELCRTTVSKNGIQIKGKVTVKNKIKKIKGYSTAYEWASVYIDNNPNTIDMFKLKDSDGRLYGCGISGEYGQYCSIYALTANADSTYNGTLVAESLKEIPAEYTVCGKSTKVYGYSTSAPTFKVKAK